MEEVFGTGLITCDAGSAPVNYSNVWMVHEVDGEWGGGGEGQELLLCPVVLARSSPQNTPGRPLWYPVCTFRAPARVSTVQYIKDNNRVGLNAYTNYDDASFFCCFFYAVLYVEANKEGGTA